MNRRSFFQQAGSSILAASLAATNRDEFYDLVIRAGRVMDPESGLDAIRHLGIKGGVVRAISQKPLQGRVILGATGLVAAPGFIDPISHGQDLENDRYQAMDGVTTVLQLESGAEDVDRWYAQQEGKRRLNYGAGVGHGHARRKVIGEGEAARRPATEAEISEMKKLIDHGLRRGALAVGFGLEYVPESSRQEALELFRVAARHGVSCHVHTRFGNVTEPGSAVEGLQEVLANAAVSGAALHMVHVPSMGLRLTPLLLQMLGEAQARGMDVTSDCYPYTAFGTGISSAVFDEGWQQKFAIDYPDLQWAATGERLTRETFEKYRKVGGMVIAHAIPEEAVRAAIASKVTMIGSDGGLRGGKGHPRGAGTYARVLGRYVRETKTVTLMEAIRKMTLLPARRLEQRASGMKRKGRIRVGADADLTVFDPKTIIDRATYDQPARFSEGIVHVLVNGIPVAINGRLQEGRLPGRAVRGLCSVGSELLSTGLSTSICGKSWTSLQSSHSSHSSHSNHLGCRAMMRRLLSLSCCLV